ncbi:F0F1 ATP synthase subunit B [Eubacterium sp. F2]|uniref:F0F1 ATP synthase subunit B n=1 Tax=Eubacterium sp. F2 TaxID=3381348 RepID=UPI0039081E7E
MKVTQGLFEFNWNFLFAIITFLVLFGILKHFFFEKVHNYMEARSKSVQDTLDHASKTSRKAEKKLKAYEKQIAGAEEEGRQIIQDARKEARVQADRIVDEANEEAHQAVMRSQQEIERQQQAARRQLRREVGDLAVEAAGRIMEKEITPEDHKEIIDKVLKDAGEKK